MKLFTFLVCGTVLLFVAAVPASAATTSVKIKGNGAKSKNTVGVKVTQKSSVAQTNFTHTLNEASVVGNTGGNTFKNVTGTDNLNLTTGSLNTTINISNVTGVNDAAVTLCGCEAASLDAAIKSNGSNSQNKIEWENSQTNTLSQTNMTLTVNGVKVVGNTGENTVKNVTGEGGSLDQESGSIVTNIAITNTSGTNTL